MREVVIRFHAANTTAVIRSIFLCLTIIYSGTLKATNGLNMIGFGAESVGMGGADLSVARDTSALNINPAGLNQIEDRQLDLNIALGYTGLNEQRDSFGNKKNNSNDIAFIGSPGYAQRLTTHPIIFGIGLFAQGGSGNEYKNVTTAFGTTDDLSILLRIARLIPGLAWQVTQRFSLGASLLATYADMKQDVFPNTSYVDPDPGKSFFGIKIRGMDAFAAGYRLGVMYKPVDRLTLGAAYNNKVDIDLNGGQLTANYSALGLGKVVYRNAEARGVNQPEEFGVGIAYQLNEQLLIATELNWINWSQAVKRSILKASDPDNPSAPPSLVLVTDNNWRDQYVLCLGFAYQWDSKTVLRAGYNYGRNPIPDEHLNPLLNATAEHHITLGIGRQLSEPWRIDSAVEWDLGHDVTYSNPQLPFGPDAENTGEVIAFHLRLSRIW
jgi:long-chain fatty acid transport protein